MNWHLITKPRTWALVIGMLGLAALPAANAFAQKDEPATQAGVDVQTRGPIHEAFAEPVMRRQGAATVVPKKAPDLINELPPEQKPEGDNVQWIPGYWAWDEDRSDFLWVSGIWRVPPPDRHWVPGYWLEADGGWRWVSGYWTTQGETTVQLLPVPPNPVEEAVPPAPDDNSGYVPGCWVYGNDGYAWRPGFWIKYRQGWTWTSAGYNWTPSGYVFVDGYWDYDLDRRGLCFAPVLFEAGITRRPGWFYRPSHVIGAEFLLGSLFIHHGWNHYFFGDYYDPLYARRGFEPWVDYRVRAGVYDPLFSYYRLQHRGDPAWERNLHNTYAARRESAVARPPHTLVQQARSQTRVVTPLNQVKAPHFDLKPVPAVHAQEIQKNAEHLRTMSRDRGHIETQAKIAPVPRVQPAATPVPRPAPHKIELPKPRETFKAPVGVHAAPPRPPHPQPQQKPQVHGAEKHR